jgi:catechol 2,3-dioxygenase-like lactoylglutathione lyase family enzyme
MAIQPGQGIDYEARREALRQTYLQPRAERLSTSARGVHHLALICSDIERTIEFYTQVLGFPLVSLFQNRDLASSTHFFFDIGHGNLLAFFDFPEHPMPPTRESVGGMHHVAISVPPEKFEAIRGRLAERGIANLGPAHVTHSVYFHDPDGALVEILREPLRTIGGHDLDE